MVLLMSETKKRKITGPTILDYLDDDCWKSVLDYLDLKEVILSELVSRQWQAMVIRYMQTLRVALNDHEWASTTDTPWPKVHWLKLEEAEWLSFEQWTEKLGSTVVYAFCCSESHLEVIRKNCPNVESLTITRFEEPISLNINNKRFKRLQQLCFNNCFSVTDCCVSQFINSNIIKLEVCSDPEEFNIRGQFLNTVKSNLNSLTLTDMDLRLDCLLSVVGWLSELKMLHLSGLPWSIFKNIHLVLDKTPKLEDLHLVMSNRRFDQLDVSEPVSRLANLKRLSGDAVFTDEHLEAVTRGCKELRVLKMGVNEVSARGLEALARHAGARLTALNLGENSKLTDDDLLICFRGCHNLTIAIQEISIPLNSKNRSFKCLQRLCFENSTAVTDQSLSQFLNSTITELEIHSNGEAEILTGQFLRSIQSKFKLLVLREVELQLEHLLSAIDWLSELKILALYDVRNRIYENIHLVLERMTKLEQLYLCSREHGLRVSQHVGRVTSLKRVGGDIISTDEDLEAVTKGCKELRYLTMGRNTVTARGLEAMARHAGARLVTLVLGSNYNLTDDDMAVCFRGCYNLKVLDVGGCGKLTAQLCPLAGEMRRDIIPRPPPLTIKSNSTRWTIQ